MSDGYLPLNGAEDETQTMATPQEPNMTSKAPRIASLDVFRGLSIALMIFVDYAGSLFPSVAHVPWNGVHLADFVMPFFLFIVGISISLVYKRISSRASATYKAIQRTAKLFLLGILLQGGYFHGVNSLAYGVDIEKIRWFGILQRIAIGYFAAAICEIWFSSSHTRSAGHGALKIYYIQWIAAFLLCGIYLALLYGLYVPDWQFEMQETSSGSSSTSEYVLEKVMCEVRGNLGPACNAAGMIDRYVLGIEHLYKKPVYRNLKECRTEGSRSVPTWCNAPFDPEGILSSFTAAVTCILGLQFGHILVLLEEHKDRLKNWFLFSLSLFAFGILLDLLGDPLNKSLYTVSYMLLTTGSAGLTFCAIYMLVDVYGYKCPFLLLEWMGKHSLSIFILVASNIAVIAIQGFYWKVPQNNIVHWIISLVAR